MAETLIPTMGLRFVTRWTVVDGRAYEGKEKILQQRFIRDLPGYLGHSEDVWVDVPLYKEPPRGVRE